MSRPIDETDRKILKILQERGRISNIILNEIKHSKVVPIINSEYAEF